MRKLIAMVAVCTVLVFGASMFAVADEGHKHGKKEPKVVTIQGEIVDMGCYIAHAAVGAEHQSCAQRCINAGMPFGLLTKDETLYLLTMNHDDEDPFHAAKTMAAAIVEITGKVQERAGMMALEVTKIKEVKPAKTD